jgi:RNA 2',3'-cyclic 3'-phosphodiesterase
MRAFIAIDLPESVRHSLAQKIDEFRQTLGQDPGIRWSRPEGIHLTLKFLGEVTEPQIGQITGAISTLEPFEKFSIDVKGFGFFRNPARPRVFWAGVVAPPDLAQWARRIENKMEELGFLREDRDYNPHLTLARFKNPRPQPTLRALAEQQKNAFFGRFEASEFFLFESKLSSQGSQYRKVIRFPLLPGAS